MIVAIAAMLILMFYGSLGLTSAPGYLNGALPSGLKFLSTPFFVYVSWILIVGVMVYISYTILYGNKSLFRGTVESKEKNTTFAAYFAGFALLTLFLSEVDALAGTIPNSLGTPSGPAFVLYGMSTVLSTIVEQLAIVVPIFYIAKFLISKGLLQSDKDSPSGRFLNLEIVVIASSIDVIIEYFIPIFGPASLSSLLADLLLNYITLKSGITRALMVNFSTTMLSVESFIALNNQIISLLIIIFLVIWAISGFSWLMSVMVRYTAQTSPKRSREELAKKYIEETDYSKLWVRSTCPNCGETKFHLDSDYSLKCDKCSQVIEKDQTGKMNIIIQTGRM